MGKKVKRKTYVSKGQRRSVVNGIKETRQARSELDRAMNKLDAWRAGKNPWITVKGTDRKHAFIKVRANDYYGDYRHRANIYRGKSSDE